MFFSTSLVALAFAATSVLAAPSATKDFAPICPGSHLSFTGTKSCSPCGTLGNKKCAKDHYGNLEVVKCAKVLDYQIWVPLDDLHDRVQCGYELFPRYCPVSKEAFDPEAKSCGKCSKKGGFACGFDEYKHEKTDLICKEFGRELKWVPFHDQHRQCELTCKYSYLPFDESKIECKPCGTLGNKVCGIDKYGKFPKDLECDKAGAIKLWTKKGTDAGHQCGFFCKSGNVFDGTVSCAPCKNVGAYKCAKSGHKFVDVVCKEFGPEKIWIPKHGRCGKYEY